MGFFPRSRSAIVGGRRGRRDKVIIATKCGRLATPGSAQIESRLSAASVRAELEASLRRLRTDYIDLYQIHWP